MTAQQLLTAIGRKLNEPKHAPHDSIVPAQDDAVATLLGATVSVVAVAWTAIILHRTDITRKRAEAEVRSLNADLEKRVA